MIQKFALRSILTLSTPLTGVFAPSLLRLVANLSGSLMLQQAVLSRRTVKGQRLMKPTWRPIQMYR
jgi:hypothetical protein